MGVFLQERLKNFVILYMDFSMCESMSRFPNTQTALNFRCNNFNNTVQTQIRSTIAKQHGHLNLLTGAFSDFEMFLNTCILRCFFVLGTGLSGMYIGRRALQLHDVGLVI